MERNAKYSLDLLGFTPLCTIGTKSVSLNNPKPNTYHAGIKIRDFNKQRITQTSIRRGETRETEVTRELVRPLPKTEKRALQFPPSQFTPMRLWTIRNAHVLVALYPILLEIIYAFVLKRRTNITRELRVFSTTYTTIVVAVLFHVYLTFVVKRLARKSIALRHEVEIAVSSRTPKEAYAKCSALYLHQALAVATVVNMAVFTRDDTGPLIKGSIERLQSIVLDAFFSGIYWCIALGVVYGIARVYGLFPGWDTLVIGYVWLVVQILQIAQKYSSNIVNTILFILFLYFYPFTFLSTQEIVMWILVHVSDVLTGLYAYNTM
ncbi:hypothetical protein WG66_005762 [Moniliophthora roreri]|nr:hypothetical protein WG66_005762 [Moniliophthora roreri]